MPDDDDDEDDDDEDDDDDELNMRPNGDHRPHITTDPPPPPPRAHMRRLRASIHDTVGGDMDNFLKGSDRRMRRGRRQIPIPIQASFEGDETTRQSSVQFWRQIRRSGIARTP